MTINLLLHNIRSVHNVGSIFRTADGCGLGKGAPNEGKIFLSGHTPAPTDRFGRTRPDIAKVALGAEKSVKWEALVASADVIGGVIDFLIEQKKKGVHVVALEQDQRAVSIEKLNLKEKDSDKKEMLLILGNEVGGIEKEILDLADTIVEIPMLGEKESLNVSVAAGIALYELCVFGPSATR